MNILLIGSANTEDIIILEQFPTEERKQKYSKLLRFEDRALHERFRGIGGSAVNWSFWLKAAAESPLLICPIGTDKRGQQVRDALSEAGISYLESDELPLAGDDTTSTEPSPSATAHSFILVSRHNSSRTVLSSPREQEVTARWSASVLSVARDALRGKQDFCAVMVGNIAGESLERRVTPQLIEAVKEANSEAFIYANLGRSQYSIPYGTWSRSLGQVNCLQFALDEAKDFVVAGEDSDRAQRPTLEETLEWFHQRELNLVITLGRAGAVTVFGGVGDREVYLTWPRYFKKQIVDPTGAGDAFGAGFVSCVSRTMRAGHDPLAEKRDRLLALGTGSIFGAMACQGYGGTGSCPTRVDAHVGDPRLLELTQCFPLEGAGDLLYALDRE
ncbi:MAG: carbohydrate kinase family protein [Pirellulaceae bacterium]